MNKDTVKGKAKQIAGSVKSKVGEVTGNRSLQAEGLKDRAVGTIQEKLGQARDKAESKH